MKRFAEYMEYKGLNDNQVTVQCGLGVGVIGGARKGKSDLGAKTIRSILEKYHDLNRIWLLTGAGNMLNDDAQPADNMPSVRGTGNIRYWEDVNASCGNVDFLDYPDEHHIRMIDVPNFSDCSDAVNIYGDSMFPLYKNGEVLIMKEWNESFIDFGNTYMIVTKNGNRMVKTIKKGSTPDKVLCVSVNSNFDSFEIRLADVQRLFLVKGSIRKDTL